MSKTGSIQTHTEPDIITRAEHSISRGNISPNALKVLYRLKDSGYQAHLVGGGVRDLLLGREPKDFDIATDATPEDVRRLFRNCRLIGRRFRLAHVLFGREVIEVATFRALQGEKEDRDERHIDDEGRIVRDNIYGNIEDDALRRDFTVNALYYNIADFSITDYARGMQDINAGLLRLIGDPVTRYREDPVRMLRAVRFATKLGFRIEEHSEEPIWQLAPLLGDIPPARLFDEMLKLFMGGHALANFEMLRHYTLFGQLFPLTEQALTHEEEHFPLTLISRGMENTDTRIAQDKPVTPAFLFALFLWQPVRERAARLEAEGQHKAEALQHAGSQIISEQAGIMSLPKRFSLPMREIWMLQLRLERMGGRRSLRVLAHPRFRAAYDFLLLRGEAGEVSRDLGEWWTDYQQKHPPQAAQADNRSRQGKGRRRHRSRSRSEGNQ
ncbi:MAG: polynucleotide adenylyltransferase PcnB [Gammaproteobacteria bacterium]|nr:polynucleotide adenylyltransferase PcnB [Gammaproteobacteria bacterium]